MHVFIEDSLIGTIFSVMTKYCLTLQYQEVGFSEFKTLPLKVHLRQTSPKNTQIAHILTHEQCMSLHDLAHFHSANMIYDFVNAEHYLARALL